MDGGRKLTMEKEKADNVTQETQAAHDNDQLGVGNFRGREDPANSFQTDGNTEGNKEDTVNESTKNFSTLPAIRVGRRGRGSSKPNCVESYDEREDIAIVLK